MIYGIFYFKQKSGLCRCILNGRGPQPCCHYRVTVHNKNIRALYRRIMGKKPQTKRKGIVAAMRKLLVLIFVLRKSRMKIITEITAGGKPVNRHRVTVKTEAFIRTVQGYCHFSIAGTVVSVFMIIYSCYASVNNSCPDCFRLRLRNDGCVT